MVNGQWLGILPPTSSSTKPGDGILSLPHLVIPSSCHPLIPASCHLLQHFVIHRRHGRPVEAFHNRLSQQRWRATRIVMLEAILCLEEEIFFIVVEAPCVLRG